MYLGYQQVTLPSDALTAKIGGGAPLTLCESIP